MLNNLKELLQDPQFNEEVNWKPYSYGSEQKIINEGENDRNIYLVLKGVVHVSTYIILNENERRGMGIAKLSENDVFGEVSMFDDMPRSANVIAAGDCEIAAIDCASFNEYLRKHPEKGYYVMRNIVEQLVKRMRHNNIRSNSILAWYLLENDEPLTNCQ